MKYKIIISAITEKEVVKEVYIPESKRQEDDSAYANKLVKEDVEEDIFQQTKEGNIDLMAVIEAFNKTVPESPRGQE